MSEISVGRSIVVHKDDFAYISHPSIAVLDNGDWLAAFNHSVRRQPYQHPPGDPLYRTMLARSRDRGQTWSAPWFAPDFDWYGTECPGIAQLRNGTVVLTQFRFAWYPLGLARKLRATGVAVAINLPGKGWTEEIGDGDWDLAERTWARGAHGLYAHLSTDGGESFGQTMKIDCGSYIDGYTRTGVVELADGRLAYIVAEHPTGGGVYALFSDDVGSSWNSPVSLVDSAESILSEPDVAEVAPGELYCILRNERPCPDGAFYLHGCRSVDGGVTWSPPAATTMDGIPGQLLNLSDGRLLCTYARRRAPFGVFCSLSEDGGRTWQVDREIIVRDNLPNRDLGYPTTIEYQPGKLFVCLRSGDGRCHLYSGNLSRGLTMKIRNVEVIQIETPRHYQTLPGFEDSFSGHLIVKVHVDDGPIGLGEASDSKAKEVATIAAQYNELLRGRDARRITEINELLRLHRFGSTITDHHLTSAIDLALYDLNGKAQGVPAYQLLGGKVRDKLYCCYPTFGWMALKDYATAIASLERVVDLGHHLFRYYVSGDTDVDNRFLSEMKDRYGDRVRLKSIDMSLMFTEWDTALLYAEKIRHHDPIHFEHPSHSMRVNAEFTKRWDLPVSLHIETLEQAHEAIELRAGTAFNLACVHGGVTYLRRIAAAAEAAGFRCLIGTDQESTIGTAAQVAVGLTLPNLSLPCDPMGPVLYMDSPAVERIRAEGSYLYPFEGPGWGVELDEEKLKRLTTAAA